MSLVALGAAVALLGTVSFIGAGDRDAAPTADPTALTAHPSPAPVDTDAPQPPSGSRLPHPLIGTSRSALVAELGAPEDSYLGGRLAFLEYGDDGARYQVVLEDDVVVEVSRID